MSMLCLPVWAPWGSLMFWGGKDVENRARPLPGRYKLPLEVLIYQGQRWDPSLRLSEFVELLGGQEAVAEVLAAGLQREEILTADFVALWLELQRGLPRRAILGTVKIVGCRQDSPSRWAAPGAWHWELTDPKQFEEPVTYLAGRQANPFFLAPAPNKQELFKPHDGATRRVDVREELADVMITRPGPWGNPFYIKRHSDRGYPLQWVVWDKREVPCVDGASTRGKAIKLALYHFEQYALEDLMARLPELKGKRLGCYCRRGQPCHGDVLVRLVKEACGDNA